MKTIIHFISCSDVQKSDEGKYICSASSESGTSSVPSFVTVVPSDSVAAARLSPAPLQKDLPGAPRKLKLVSSNSSTITLAWSPPESEGSSPITSYILEVGIIFSSLD